MKNNIKLFLVLAACGIMFTSCDPNDGLASPRLQGTWSVSWVKSFDVAIPNAGKLGALCNPGATVDLDFAGTAEMRFTGSDSAFNGNAIMRIGDRANNSAPPASLADGFFYFDCNDITVSSIEHRSIYITGQPGYISKYSPAPGVCQLRSDPNVQRTRPKYTVFIKFTGSQIRTDRYGNVVTNQGQTQSDDNNRLAGITYDCDDSQLEAVSRVKGAGSAPALVTNETMTDLKKATSALSDKKGLFEESKAIPVK